MRFAQAVDKLLELPQKLDGAVIVIDAPEAGFVLTSEAQRKGGVAHSDLHPPVPGEDIGRLS